MAMGTGEIVMLVFLLLVLVIAISWLVIALKYRKNVTSFNYTRGINIHPPPPEKCTAPSTFDDMLSNPCFTFMKCDNGKKIKINKATIVDTDPTKNIYNYGTDGRSKYGSFNTDGDGAFDVTKDIQDNIDEHYKRLEKDDGTALKETTDFLNKNGIPITLREENKYANGLIVVSNHNIKENVQLIGTYTCSTSTD